MGEPGLSRPDQWTDTQTDGGDVTRPKNVCQPVHTCGTNTEIKPRIAADILFK